LPLFDLVPGRRFGSWSMVEEWTRARNGAAMKPTELHARFLAHVAGGIAKADRDDHEHFARIRALPKLPRGSRERIRDLRGPVRATVMEAGSRR
jgi:hypothetical protein